jgi:hypothetical protein
VRDTVFITPEPLFGWRGEATLVIDESDGEWIDIVHVRLYSKDLILKRTESKSFGCVYDYDMKWIFVPNAEQEEAIIFTASGFWISIIALWSLIIVYYKNCDI